MFAITAASCAKTRVLTTQTASAPISGAPPIAKWLTEPVNAVALIINTLVPTAVLSSYPKTEVSTSSIIIPPPAPTKPQINPTPAPHITERTAFWRTVADERRFLGATTGFTINLTPKIKVINTEKPPIAVFGTMLATKLPQKVKAKTEIIIIMPFLISRFLFFP